METIIKRLSKKLASSWIMEYPKKIHKSNLKKWDLSNKDKILASIYLILNDFGEGKFPPKYIDRNKLYDLELKCSYVGHDDKIKGLEDLAEDAMRIPWDSDIYLNRVRMKNIKKILSIIKKIKLRKGSRILEVAGADGWLSEILCLNGFNTTLTTLNPRDINLARIRSDSLKIKKLNTKMNCFLSPMEKVHEIIKKNKIPLFDVIVCHGSLHHSFDWKESIISFKKCLKKNGFLILCDEPIWHHTFICYRTCKILGTYEVGLREKEVLKFLKNQGFEILLAKKRLDFSLPLWVVARKKF